MTVPPVGIRENLRRAWEVLRQEGLRSLWFKILGETVYRRLQLIERQIGNNTLAGEPGRPPGCRTMTEGEVNAYLEFRQEGDSDAILRRLRDGQTCFLVRDAETLAHSCWAATRCAHISYLQCDIRLTPDAVYVYEVFTDPRFRGRSISTARSLEMEHYFQTRGFRRLVAAVGPENWSASRSKDKAGYVVVGTIGYFRLGRFKRHFLHYVGQEAALHLAPK